MTGKTPARSADEQARKEQRVFEEKWMRRVMHEPGLTASEKVGAVAYLDFIHRKQDKDFRCAWASGPTLVARCNLGDHTLDSLFSKLRNLGYLELVRRRGYNGTNMHRFVLPELRGWDWLDNLSSDSLTPMSREEKAVRKLLAEPDKTGRPRKRGKSVEPQKTGNPEHEGNEVGPQKTWDMEPQKTWDPEHEEDGVGPQKTWDMEPQKTWDSAPQKTWVYPLDDTLEVNTGKRSHGQDEVSNTGTSSGEPEPDWVSHAVEVQKVRAVSRPVWDSSKTFRDFEPQSDDPPF